ncbi:MAG TPA: methyltransferase domain-containing protein [Gemmatimonadota bacterium]|nr:methyltransferase domain-containing protein [Gemmatimonadota bacterium]
MRQRQKLVPLARGRVLEVGVGTGLNLPFYDPANVGGIWGLDPSPEMIDRARDSARSVPFGVEFVEAGAEEIPLDADSFDTVLLTYTLCSIADVEPALREMARVLRPGGALLFCEHGAAPDPGVRRWQDWLNPIWRRVGGGCRLNRDIPTLIRSGGFEITDLESMYIPGWRPASFNYWGSARAV